MPRTEVPHPSRQELLEHDPESGTVHRSDGKLMCLCCCRKDGCDDPTHHDRMQCPHCGGTGALPEEGEWSE